ncbi:3'-5' exonuclease [Anaeromyxobacter oryzae]|uniref:Polysaccharide biosynthesis protein n=1 Tax=Anaeromyxobacter oryzae TaxID=2918170 RepID=A0ABM7X1Y5_9BACT|nr:3'-5' exonuclease [Anaeromyxobacter oryzae]BDG05795.1 polysaccharide biosynthesis protein [Anaeromyxobacter oryzae]
MRRFVTLDLETVPDEALVSAVDGEPTRPYTEQLRRVLDARRARTGGRSDFLPLPYHRPIAACLLEAVEDGGVVQVTDAVAWTDAREPEAELLEGVWRRLEGASLVTFHGKGFDLPVLELRSLKHGIPTPAWFAAARRSGGADHHDLKELLAGAATAAPLDLYAKLVGLPGKEDVAGADVQALYAAGALDRIAAYCMSDVVQTFLLFLRLRLVDGSLTPDGYAESAEAARQTLPRLLARRLRPAERTALDGFLDRCAPFFATAAEPAPARAG